MTDGGPATGAGPQPMTNERRARLEDAAKQHTVGPLRQEPGKTRTAGPPPRRPAPKRSPVRARPPSDVDHAEAIKGILSIPAAVLLIVGQRTKSLPLLADSVTITVHGEHVANAAAEVAEHDPRFAAAIERLATFGPYGALFAAILPMGAQIAVNHGAPAPLMAAFGAAEPAEFLRAHGITIESEQQRPSEDGKVTPEDARV